MMKVNIGVKAVLLANVFDEILAVSIRVREGKSKLCPI